MLNQFSTRPMFVNNPYTVSQQGVNNTHIRPPYSAVMSDPAYSDMHSTGNINDSDKIAQETTETKDTHHLKFSQVKPIFIRDCDLYGKYIPQPHQKNLWVTDIEIYKCLATIVHKENIWGIQRTGGPAWRVYPDTMKDRLFLLSNGVPIRGRRIPFVPENPRSFSFNIETMTKLRVSNVPLSADDGQIRRVLT